MAAGARPNRMQNIRDLPRGERDFSSTNVARFFAMQVCLISENLWRQINSFRELPAVKPLCAGIINNGMRAILSPIHLGPGPSAGASAGQNLPWKIVEKPERCAKLGGNPANPTQSPVTKLTKPWSDSPYTCRGPSQLFDSGFLRKFCDTLCMGSIRFGSINTGLPPNIVDQLIEAERIPVKQMEQKKAKSEEKLKLVQDLDTKVQAIRGSLGELANTRGFTDVKLTSGDPNILTGTVDPATYQPGSWNIEVVQLAQKASVMTNGFPDKDKTELGVGYFRFKTPSGNKDVYINQKNNTLDGAAKAINSANVGVRAAVINDRKDADNPFKLVMSSDGVGTDKSVEYPRLYFLDGDQDLYFDGEIEAKNGIVKVDGFEFEIGDNTLKDVIPGVTLELKQASPGRSVNIGVKEDLEVVSGKIKTFVDALNSVLSFVQTQNKMGKDTDTTKTLGGDSLIRSVEGRLRQMIQNPQYGIKGEIRTLNQLGIAFNRNGTLDFDQKKFNAVLASRPEHVQEFFAGDGFSTGFIAAVRREVTNLTAPNFGPIANRTQGIKSTISQMDSRIEQKERQLARKEEQLRDKFARLEETMSRIKGQGAQVAAIAGGGGGGIPGLG